jgi:hypothetical protein
MNAHEKNWSSTPSGLVTAKLAPRPGFFKNDEEGRICPLLLG